MNTSRSPNINKNPEIHRLNLALKLPMKSYFDGVLIDAGYRSMTEFFQQCTDDIVAAVEAKRAKEGQRPKIRILPI
jgi:hypothetical protein